MRKLVLMIMAGIMLLALVGCGETKETEVKEVGEIRITPIQVEEIIVEEIQVEEIQTERIYIDGEYSSELEYNSRVNTWDSGSNVTYWD